MKGSKGNQDPQAPAPGATEAPLPIARLATVEGLRAAGILEDLRFDGMTGFIAARYTARYLRILVSGRIPIADPIFGGALTIDDPVAMRAWVEREAALLAEEASAPPPAPIRGRGRRGAQ